MLRGIVLVILTVCALSAVAQERGFRLSAPAELVETGLLKHILPRFSLKQGIRITLVQGNAEATFGATGVPVFRQGDRLWHFRAEAGPYTDAFRDWLRSDVGRRTIEGFAPGTFSTELQVADASDAPESQGDVALGAEVSLRRCGRCHVVSAANRMNAIGSTPSFALMRGFPDWERRFLTFFTLRPHPAFTQVAEVTAPFPANLPPPIAPIEVTLEEIHAIVAFVATIAPADLGAPIRSQ